MQSPGFNDPFRLPEDNNRTRAEGQNQRAPVTDFHAGPVVVRERQGDSALGARRRGDTLLRHLAIRAAEKAVMIKLLREWALGLASRYLHDSYCKRNTYNLPLGVQEMRHMVLMNLLRGLACAIGDGRLSRRATRGILEVLFGRQLMGARRNIVPFINRRGFEPPSFLAISPTRRCNLRCAGCYASSSMNDGATLEYEVFRRVLQEIRDDWGSHFAVISGGEPFLYKSDGRTLLDVLGEFPDEYFLVFSNGTRIGHETARHLAGLGNVTVAVSVEGFARETDARRGPGVYREIERTMKALRQAGVPFGISMTATRQNADLLLSEEIIKHYFDDQGAVYAWLFHYMPIGRDPLCDLMVTPEQRSRLLERQLDLLWNRKLFFIDFWNGGPLSAGCISAGRKGGYFHIDWDGNVSPCVFIPYAVDNVYRIYREGRALSSVLDHPTFKAIREWQTSYQGNHGTTRTRNLFMPCPMRDHHGVARDAVVRYGAQPLNADSAHALEDPQYVEQLQSHGRRCAELLDPLWETVLADAARAVRRSSSPCTAANSAPRRLK